MSRGYLWEDLGGEVAAEFDALLPHLDVAAAARSRRGRETLLGKLEDREFSMEDARFAAEYRRMRESMADARRTAPPRQSAPARPVEESRGCTKPYCKRERIAGRSWCQHHVDIAEATKRRKALKEKLPDDREGPTHHFTIYARAPGTEKVIEVKGYITANTYPDG